MKKIGKILIWIIAALMIATTVFAIFYAVVIPYSDYLKNKDDLVKTTATISHIYEFEDSDDDTCYEIYLTYEYDDKLYENIFWEETYKDGFRIGQKIPIEISSVNPKYIRKTDIGTRSLICVLIFIAGIVAAMMYDAGFYKLRNTDDVRVIDENAIMWELSPRVMLSFINAVIGFGASMYGASLFSPDLVTNTKYADLCFWGGLALIVITVLCLRKPDMDGYTITTNKCIKKWTESDSDTTLYYVNFENLPFDKSVGRKVYPHSEEGEFYYVLSNKKGEIMEVYDVRRWALKVDRDNLKNAGKKVIFKALKNAAVCSFVMFFAPLMFEVVARFLANI